MWAELVDGYLVDSLPWSPGLEPMWANLVEAPTMNSETILLCFDRARPWKNMLQIHTCPVHHFVTQVLPHPGCWSVCRASRWFMVLVSGSLIFLDRLVVRVLF